MSLRRSSKSRRRVRVLVRIVLILILIVLAGAVTFYLVRRTARPAAVRSEARAIPEQKVDAKDETRYLRITPGKNILEVWAPRIFTDAEGLSHAAGRADDLQSRVRLEIRGRSDGRMKFEISTAELVYDANWTHMIFRGGVHVRMEGLEIEGSVFDYRQKENVITSDAPVSFKGARFRGECRRAVYDMDKQRVRFTGGINLVVNPWANDSTPLAVSAATLTYERYSRMGEISGNVRLTHGRSFGRMNTLRFAQYTNKDEFRLFEFLGGVRIETDEQPAARSAAAGPTPGSKQPPVSDEGLIFLQGGRQRLEAEEVSLLPYGDQDWLHLIAVRQGGRLEILDDAGGQTTMEAGEMKFFYNEDGSLRDFMFEGRTRIRGDAEGRSRLIEAPKMDFNANAGNIVATGGLENRARTISAGREVTADKLIINIRNNDFRFSGDVRIVSLPQPGAVREAALFDAKQTMFMTAGVSAYEAVRRRFYLEEKARLWQGRNSLEADQVSIFEDTGGLTAKGAVRSVFFQRPRGKDADEQIEITADLLTRDAETNKVVYSGACTLTTAGIIMTAGKLTLEPGQEAGKYRRIIGEEKRVVILQGPNKAEGDNADYDLIEDVIVLTGRPVLDQKDKGVIQCGKLTFHPADGKILIEKQSAERSATIIKS